MRKRWWQSIRGRLALGSALLILLTTGLLAFTAMLVTYFSYDIDRTKQMDQFASGMAQQIGLDLTPSNKYKLAVASRDILTITSSRGEYLPIVVNYHSQLVYPNLPFKTSNGSTIYPHNAVIASLVRLTGSSISGSDAIELRADVRLAFRGYGKTDLLGHAGPLGLPQPFVVRPIYNYALVTRPVIGVLILTPRTGDIPIFIASVGRIVFIASLIIAVLAALLAILFGRTITRPLANLAGAARVMQSGDYSARVTTDAPGELGELAQTFNEMAAQLHRDMEELRQQELWRRELIMNITHDLATPLTAIAGLGESLVDGVNQSRDDYEATGQIIVRETLRLRRLVKDLHVMAKVEAGALSPACKPVRLAALVDEVLAVLAPEFERAHVEPNNVIAYNLPVVQADPDMLTRVFSNLCDNALRHTPADGCVTVATEQHGQALVISVTDTGEGIPPEALPRIFERFFRADTARQSSTGGSGLGLAIVQAIVEAHHGKIWAENVPDGGASIKFTLPLPVDSVQVLSEVPTQPVLEKQSRHSGKFPTETDNAVVTLHVP
jgi:signal transduction histidine kinase